MDQPYSAGLSLHDSGSTKDVNGEVHDPNALLERALAEYPDTERVYESAAKVR